MPRKSNKKTAEPKTAQELGMNVEVRALDVIKPYWRNARDHDPALPALKKSIQEYGFNQPLVVDTDGVIIVGHGRYRALRELGWTEAPVVVVDMPDEKAKEYRVADNKIHEMTKWDMNELQLELRELGAEAMQEFFPTMDLDAWLSESVGSNLKPVTDDDLQKAAEKLNEQYTDTGGKKYVKHAKVLCPHCTEEFFVDPQWLKLEEVEDAAE